MYRVVQVDVPTPGQYLMRRAPAREVPPKCVSIHLRRDQYLQMTLVEEHPHVPPADLRVALHPYDDFEPRSTPGVDADHMDGCLPQRGRREGRQGPVVLVMTQ
eukprot:3356518-Pyramimonas_sp.AAC.1